MKLNLLPFIFLSANLFSQSSANYERSWGTYFGATESKLSNIYEASSTDIIADAITYYHNPSTPAPTNYFDQFVHSSSNFFTPGNNTSENNFSGKFGATGNLLLAEYNLYTISYANKKYPVFRDEAGNRYDIESDLTQYPTLSNGVWHSDHATTSDAILAKYDSSGTLVWKTYIPSDINSKFILKTDNNGNIYLTGETKWQSLGDPGTYEPNYTSTVTAANSYLIKFNSAGQKTWATYIPAKSIKDIDVYSGSIYIVAGNDLDPSLAELSTTGTFQQTKGANSILRINANDGQRIWGTYYGSSPNLIDGTIANIKVTSSGVYILGSSTNPGNYYGTEGAFKNSTVDGFDLFVARFDDEGKRKWGSYLGSDFPELLIGEKNLDVKNDKILVSGMTTGSQNISTPGAFLETKPSIPATMDIFFSMFTTTGSLIFTSYYGGPFVEGQGTAINNMFSPNSDSFYLYGSTLRKTGYTTPNGNQSNIIFPTGQTGGGTTGYIVKFSSSQLSTTENYQYRDLNLFNNPNNGNFTLRGKILGDKHHIVRINDLSGRLIYSESISKNTEIKFNLSDKLSSGNYILSVSNNENTQSKNFKLIIKK